MGNIENKLEHNRVNIEKEDIIRYDMTLHKLIHNDTNILHCEKEIEKKVDNDIRLVSNITDSNKVLMQNSPYNIANLEHHFV
tara:strand:+ start:5135 stop:5380 length:246 start_codon:yes stop_codon:yes gene_type:complete